MSKWTLFSNHGHVLLFLANDPEARLRDVAAAVGITERAVQKIVRDLQDGGVLSVSKHGRRKPVPYPHPQAAAPSARITPHGGQPGQNS